MKTTHNITQPTTNEYYVTDSSGSRKQSVTEQRCLLNRQTGERISILNFREVAHNEIKPLKNKKISKTIAAKLYSNKIAIAHREQEIATQ